MGKVSYSALVNEVRGAIGGGVYSKNSSGNYIRSNAVPTNPKTTSQTAVRAMLASLSQAWRTLTDAQRAQLNSAVTNWLRTDVFGKSMTPSGFNLYMQLNLKLNAIGVASIDVPPVPQGTGVFDTFTAAIAAGAATASITFAPAIEAGTSVIIKATPGISAGRSFVSSELRQIAVLESTDVSPENIKAAYIATFGSLPGAGSKVFFSAQFVNATTGQAGQDLQTSCIVAA